MRRKKKPRRGHFARAGYDPKKGGERGEGFQQIMGGGGMALHDPCGGPGNLQRQIAFVNLGIPWQKGARNRTAVPSKGELLYEIFSQFLTCALESRLVTGGKKEYRGNQISLRKGLAQQALLERVPLQGIKRAHYSKGESEGEKEKRSESCKVG